MRIPFIKMHGLGNDFIIIDQRTQQPYKLNHFQIQQLADRRLGIGCDQVIILTPSDNADCRIVIYNSDGSQSNACGNATRCVALLLGKNQTTLEIGNKMVSTTQDENNHIAVDMGKPSYNWQDIPLAHQVPDTSSLILLPELPPGACVNVGNPHVVFFLPTITNIELAKFGPLLEHHALFPERVNVSIVAIRDQNNLTMRTWERGVGETFACGSAACAAVAIGHRLGKLANVTTVHLPYGNLMINVREDGGITMTGPATLVAEGDYVMSDHVIL